MQRVPPVTADDVLHSCHPLARTVRDAKLGLEVNLRLECTMLVELVLQILLQNITLVLCGGRVLDVSQRWSDGCSGCGFDVLFPCAAECPRWA